MKFKKPTIFIISLLFAVISPLKVNAQLGNLLNGGKKSQPITGDIHKKYMGKFVFASSEKDLELQKENESSFTSKFEFGKPIFFRLYLEKSLSDYSKKLAPLTSDRADSDWKADFDITIYLDDKVAITARYNNIKQLTKEEKYNTTFLGAFVATEKDHFLQSLYTQFISENVKKFTPGDHKVKIEIKPMYNYGPKIGNIIGQGEFSLVVKPGAQLINPDDESICIPKRVNTGIDKKLEKDLYSFHAKKYGFKEGSKDFMLRLLGDNWEITKNDLTGYPKLRTIRVMMAWKDKDSCFLSEYTMAQDFDGMEYQRYYIKFEFYKKDIPCECMNSVNFNK